MSIARKILMGAAGAGGDKTYVDDVFSTYLYEGNETARTINNGVDTTKGAMVWVKNRDNASFPPYLYDTQRGTNKQLRSSSNAAETSGSNTLTAFNNNGISLGTDTMINRNNDSHVAWSFRKSEAFFTIKQYTGSGSTQSLTHDLGTIPGCIMVKRTDSTADWGVYHRGQNGGVDPEDYRLRLNSTTTENNDTYWGDTAPTATHFTVGDAHTEVNANGGTYVAYIFAGGESTAATARSVHFQSSTGWMNTPAVSDFAFGTGDFTIECWAKFDSTSNNGGLFNLDTGTGLGGTDGIAVGWNGSNWVMYAGNGSGQYSASTFYKTAVGNWYHVAYVRQSNTTKLYINGKELISATDSTNYSTNFALAVGGYAGTSYTFDGKISNLRILKGTALYTSSFRPPTEPLTNITNTKMLCCNSSSADGVSVGPSLTAWGSSTASTDSPFDDPEGFKFGEGGDQNIIKCGYYKTDSNEDANVDLGWEPQWVLGKRTDSSTGGDWFIIDSMRGFMNAQDTEANNGGSRYIEPNTSDAEANTSRMGLTSTGFYADQYGANRSFIYIAIRRPDPLVGKPAEAGTDVFTMDVGHGGSTSIPTFDSGFPVDLVWMKQVASTGNNSFSSRLTGGGNGGRIVRSNTTDAETSPNSTWSFDWMDGWNNSGAGTDYQSWMWKRHAGFDVVTYDGNGSTRTVNHSLGRVPEMIWIKARNDAQNWLAYHKGLNGGTTPWNYHILLNTAAAEGAYSFINQPTTIDFAVTSGWQANNKNYIAMLFASVDGISSVGSYAPSSSSTTVTCGFQPRFVIVKAATKNNNWAVADSLRGITAGNDPALVLDENWENDKYGSADWIDVSATGFTVNSAGGAGTADANSNGETYIYYAHA